MGLFSGRKQITVSTDVSRVIPDAQLPSTSKVSLVRALFDSTSISEELVDGMLNSVAVRADKMYSYAKRAYPIGLPNSTLVTSLNGESVVQRIITAEVGFSVALDYFQFSPINSIHVAWKRLVEDHGYNPQTNQIGRLTAQYGNPVYLKNMVAVYSPESLERADASTFEQWGLSPQAGVTPERAAAALGKYILPTPYEQDELALTDVVRIEYAYEEQVVKEVLAGGTPRMETQLRTGSFLVGLEGFDEAAEYYQVKYTYNDQGAQKTGYWCYRKGSNQLSEVEAIQETRYEGIGAYFPFVYFRYDFQNQNQPELIYDDIYVTSRKMLKYISMDYAHVAEAMNSNPGIDDIIHSMMAFGIPAKSEDPIDAKYLFNYFNLLYFADGGLGLGGSVISDVPQVSTTARQRRVEVQDSRFSMTFAYQGISKRRQAGSIGKRGTCTNHRSGNSQVYRYQINDVFFEEVQLLDPSVSYRIQGKHTFSGGIGSDILLIPLDKSVLGGFSLNERETLYCRSMHYINCSFVETELKWYQTKVFRLVMIIVAIVVTVFTGGAGGAIASAFSAGSVGAVAMALLTLIVKAVVISLVAQKVFTLVAKAIGAEAALVLAVVLAVVGVSIQFTTSTANGALWAERLVQASTNLAQATQDQIISGMDALNQDFESFNLLKSESQVALEDGQKLLGMQNLIDPFAFIAQTPKLVFGEAPDSFYQRTVHSGNIGVVGIDAISSFVDLSLTLPKVNDSLGDTQDEHF
jgi:hypothetical protein